MQTTFTESDQAEIGAALRRSSALPPWARGAALSPVLHEFDRLFPRTNHFEGFLNTSEEEFDAMTARDAAQDARINVLVRGLSATVSGDESFRTPACRVARHADAYRTGLFVLNPYARRSPYLQLATHLMLENLHRQAAGAFVTRTPE